MDFSEEGVKTGEVTEVRHGLLGAHVLQLARREHPAAANWGRCTAFASHHEENWSDSAEVEGIGVVSSVNVVTLL